MLIAFRAASRAVAADMMMLPPFAFILPLFWIRAVVPPAVVGTPTCRKPSPEKSSVATSPEPIATLPRGTLMYPELATVPPMSAV